MEYPKYRITELGTILFEKQILVPKLMRVPVVKGCYKQLPHRHLGIRKTIELVSRIFYFSRMKKIVEKVINIYNKYCRNKAARHLLYRKLQLLEAPAGAWKSVSIDFITGLLFSKELLTSVEWNSILVIVDRLTKYAYFIL